MGGGGESGRAAVAGGYVRMRMRALASQDWACGTILRTVVGWGACTRPQACQRLHRMSCLAQPAVS